MARIDGYDLPPEIAEELKKMLAGAPDRALLDYSRDIPEISKGFRPGAKRAVGVIRKRLAGILDTDYELDDMLLAIIAAGCSLSEFISSVSVVVMEDLLDALARLVGRNLLLASLLVDAREELRELAMDVLDGETEIKDLSEDEARKSVQRQTMPILAGVADWLGITENATQAAEGEAGVSTAPPLGEADSGRLRARVKELERELATRETRAKSEKALRKKVEQLKQKTQQLEKSLRDAEKETAREKHAHAEIKDELRKARQEEAALRESLDSRVEQGVSRELSTLRERWLLRPLTVEKEAEKLRRGTDGDLLSAAEKLLEKQAQLDRHSGNIAVLRERAETLRKTIGRVNRARSEALHPLAELEQVEKQLRTELTRLEDILGRAVEIDGDAGFVGSMLGRINSAAAGEEVNRLRDVLDRLNEIEALSTSQLTFLYKAYHDRMARLYAAFTPKVVRKEERRDDPVWRLQQAIEENRPLIVILDGHNVVHLLTGLFEDAYREGVPGRDAREKLVESMCGIFASAEDCKVEIFFDGPSRSAKLRAPNVREVYSGGGNAEHRADRAIIEYLDYCCSHMSAMPRILVSDDRDLRKEAGERGARIMTVPEFGAFLESVW